MKFTWSSFKQVRTPKTIGHFVEIDLPLLGIEGVRAKVDTGAFTGALHAGQIREVVNAQGNKQLRFSPLASRDHTVEVDNYHKRRVKSSNGVVSIRYAIDTDVTILGQTYPITLTLANRNSMKFPMLVGRNFLRIHGFLIDVGRDSK